MTQNNENTPQAPAKPPLRKRMRDRLEETLDEHQSTLPTGLMVEQSNILDRAFRHLVARGIEYGDTPIFLAAFKAQNQYRMTLKALESHDSPKGGNKKT